MSIAAQRNRARKIQAGGHTVSGKPIKCPSCGFMKSHSAFSYLDGDKTIKRATVCKKCHGSTK